MVHILTLDMASEEVVTLLTEMLGNMGLRVRQSFDLQSALAAHSTLCTCPNHGTTQCDCQYVVLLAYNKAHGLVTVLVHSHDGQTWVHTVEDNFPEAASPVLWDELQGLLETQSVGL